MNLFINSPSYYTKEYGVIDEIYSFCNYISKRIDITCYTKCLDTIGIVPMIAPKTVLSEIKWKSRKHISLVYRMADISLSSDFDEYHLGDIEIKKQIMLENILESMMVIKKKLGKEFNFVQMERDILNVINEIK
jgi:hypothetical protein